MKKNENNVRNEDFKLRTTFAGMLSLLILVGNGFLWFEIFAMNIALLAMGIGLVVNVIVLAGLFWLMFVMLIYPSIPIKSDEKSKPPTPDSE